MFKINDIISGRRRTQEDGGNYTQLYGIEIEVENVQDTEWIYSTNWSIKEDGSLRRGGCEFYTPPLSFDDSVTALESFYAQPTGTFGPRCGIHVHVDMRTRTIQQVLTFATLYGIVEPVLFDQFCGEEREECTYCVPWYRSNEDAAALYDIAQQLDAGRAHSQLHGMCKYSALNLNSLSTFGTVEFRGAPTFERREDMLVWLTTIRNLVQVAAQYATPYAVIEAAETQLLQMMTELAVPRPEDAVSTINRYETIPKTADMYIPGETGTGERVDDGSNWGFGDSLQVTMPAAAEDAPRERRVLPPLEGRYVGRGSARIDPPAAELEAVPINPGMTAEERHEEMLARQRLINENLRQAEIRARAERESRRDRMRYTFTTTTTGSGTDWGQQ